MLRAIFKPSYLYVPFRTYRRTTLKLWNGFRGIRQNVQNNVFKNLTFATKKGVHNSKYFWTAAAWKNAVYLKRWISKCLYKLPRHSGVVKSNNQKMMWKSWILQRKTFLIMRLAKNNWNWSALKEWKSNALQHKQSTVRSPDTSTVAKNHFLLSLNNYKGQNQAGKFNKSRSMVRKYYSTSIVCHRNMTKAIFGSSAMQENSYRSSRSKNNFSFFNLHPEWKSHNSTQRSPQQEWDLYIASTKFKLDKFKKLQLFAKIWHYLKWTQQLKFYEYKLSRKFYNILVKDIHSNTIELINKFAYLPYTTNILASNFLKKNKFKLVELSSLPITKNSNKFFKLRLRTRVAILLRKVKKIEKFTTRVNVTLEAIRKNKIDSIALMNLKPQLVKINTVLRGYRIAIKTMPGLISYWLQQQLLTNGSRVHKQITIKTYFKNKKSSLVHNEIHAKKTSQIRDKKGLTFQEPNPKIQKEKSRIPNRLFFMGKYQQYSSETLLRIVRHSRKKFRFDPNSNKNCVYKKLIPRSSVQQKIKFFLGQLKNSSVSRMKFLNKNWDVNSKWLKKWRLQLLHSRGKVSTKKKFLRWFNITSKTKWPFLKKVHSLQYRIILRNQKKIKIGKLEKWNTKNLHVSLGNKDVYNLISQNYWFSTNIAFYRDWLLERRWTCQKYQQPNSRYKDTNFVYQLYIKPHLWVNNIRYHTTIHPDYRYNFPWLEPIIYARSYRNYRLYARIWLRRKNQRFTKRNRLYKSFQYFLYNGWSPTIRKRTFFRLSHLLKRIVFPFYGHIKFNRFKRMVLRERFKKGKARDVLSYAVDRLERRLDVIAYRLNFAPTIWASQWLIKNGYIKLNSKVIKDPKTLIQNYDIIQLSDIRRWQSTVWKYMNQRPELFVKTIPANIHFNFLMQAGVIINQFSLEKTELSERIQKRYISWLGLSYF